MTIRIPIQSLQNLILFPDGVGDLAKLFGSLWINQDLYDMRALTEEAGNHTTSTASNR